MNAIELADYMDDLWLDECKQAATMLRQQQAEIEALKADNKKAYAFYTQDQLEKARKLGMQQERAMWNLAESSQQIMDTHPVKEHFEDEPQAEELHEILQSNIELTDEKIWEVIDNYFGVHAFNLDYQISLDEAREDAFELVKAVLRKAQEK